MRLSEQANKFLIILRQYSGNDHWLSRSDIADLIGKKRLNPYEVAAIDLLAENGLIERTREQMPGPIGYQWKYRVLNNVVQAQPEAN